MLLNKGFDPIVLSVLYLTTILSATVSIHALKHTLEIYIYYPAFRFKLLRKIAANALHLFDVRNF